VARVDRNLCLITYVSRMKPKLGIVARKIGYRVNMFKKGYIEIPGIGKHDVSESVAKS